MGLTLCVFGAVPAHGACQLAVLTALVAAAYAPPCWAPAAVQYDGADKAKPCA